MMSWYPGYSDSEPDSARAASSGPFASPVRSPASSALSASSLEPSEPERPSRRLASTQRDNHRIERILDQELRGRHFLGREAMQE